ncbi:transposase [Frankia gtarii]|uniref:transposase n=1 Tax=Frankia gtarii TaxID=2950102 RepID=UPI0021BFABF9|nr:transposase [Frankia gtarii]
MDLPSQYRHLVSQDEELHVLRGVPAHAQQHQPESVACQGVEQRPHHDHPACPTQTPSGRQTRRSPPKSGFWSPTPFHVVAWATAAVDAVRRKTVNALRGEGDTVAARDLKSTRWALLKNPENQTGDQRTTVAAIAKTNKPLYRAYLLKEQLRAVFAVGGDKGRKLLAGWLAWAKRSRIPEFAALAATVEK